MIKDSVAIFTGTNCSTGIKFLNKDFNDLTWWSDDYETLAHYYEGCAIEITVKLDSSKQEYVRDYGELNCDVSDYTYGYAEMECPKGAVWYSFSAPYLKKNVIEVKEIYPDLSKYMEDDE